MKSAEGHERQRHAMQHELGGQHHQNEISAREKAQRAQNEEHGSDGQIITFEFDHHSAPPRRRGAIAIAPIVATKSSVPASSTANRYSPNSERPRPAIVFVSLSINSLPGGRLKGLAADGNDVTAGVAVRRVPNS